MKKRFTRLTALLLALLMLMSMAYAESDASVTKGQYDASLTKMIDDLSLIPTELEEPEVKTIEVDTTTLVPTYKEGAVTPESSIAVKANTAPEATNGYQWMIKVGDVWAKIDGATEQTLNLTYAMAKPAMDENGEVQLRCRLFPATETASEGAEEAVYEDTIVLLVDDEVTYTEQDNDEPMVIEVTEYMKNEEPDENYYAAWAFQNAANTPAKTSAVSTYAVARDGEQLITELKVVVEFIYEDGRAAADPIQAQLYAGDDYNELIKFPEIVGYLPWLDTDGDKKGDKQCDSYQIAIENIQVPIVYTVEYKPTMVNYTVINLLQNVEDDGYTAADPDVRQGLTNDRVVDATEEIPGFYPLAHKQPIIAADGSTKIEVKYNRYYYLMLFDLDGGYGVDPIYAKYGTPVTAAVPNKAGFKFGGWSPAVPDKMPVGGGTYKAIWTEPQTVKYTIVYWRENADDDGYSFWQQETREAVAGTYVSGSDTLAASSTQVNGITEKNYFTYSDRLTDKDVYINGDGSSVVNVYYSRNVYTLTFYYNGNCMLEEHTHSDACRELACGLEEHDHETAGCSITCGKTEHVHEDRCCSKTEHATHTTACYGSDVGNGPTDAGYYAPNDPKQGQVYYRRFNERYYIYIGNGWYEYNSNSISSGQIAPTTSDCPGLHTHGDGYCTYTCNSEAHVHGTNCYDCGKTEHAHTQEDCYKLTCGKPVHTHSNANCQYSGSNNDQSGENGYRIYKVITAKYDAYIGDEWPTAADISGFAYWTGTGVSNQSSKLLNMVANICVNTGDKNNKFLAHYNSTKYTLNYMFESFDQESPANQTTRLYYDGKYYDKSEEYSQEAYYSSGLDGWGYKDISGLTPAQSGDASISNRTAWLYYNRLRFTFTFVSFTDQLFTTGKNVMFEQPLKDYTYNNVKLSTFEPPEDYYPEGLEKGVYVFEGWYTTPECYAGTEFDFTNAEMPNGDLTLYANWVPVERKVEFYLNSEALEAQQKIGDTHPDLSVPHGSKVEEAGYPIPATPTHPDGDYTFVGWFYMEDGVEKAFDFKNMQVTKDLKVYGKWSSDVLKEYVVYFKIKGTDTEIADPIYGSNLAGETETFQAKVEGELYDGYRAGYFPLINSHSIILDIKTPETADGEDWVEIEDEDGNKKIVQSYTFEYVKMDAVPYTVYYVTEKKPDNADLAALGTVELDGKTYYLVAKTKPVSDNTYVVVTETFEPVIGYRPDAYQKKLVIAAGEGAENKIVFYYVVDTENTYYTVVHMLQNANDDDYTDSGYTDSYLAKIGLDVNANDRQRTFTGFEFVLSKSEVEEDGETRPIGGDNVKLTAKGFKLILYYDRETYPYEVRYLEQGTNNVLHGPKPGTGRYEEVVTEKAIAIDGYGLVSDEEQSITIEIETTPTSNVITFYYEKLITINYVAVGPEGLNDNGTPKATVAGSVAPESETLKVQTDSAQGSIATPNSPTYKFVGWYNNAACTGDPISTALTFVPQKVDGKNVAATYYAKFDWNISTLTITKEGMAEGESAIFTVTAVMEDGEKTFTVTVPNEGSVTIHGVIINSAYTVTELGNWTWRYTSKATGASGKIAPTGSTAAFTNTTSNNKWLDDEYGVHNEFNVNGQGTKIK